MLLFAEASNRDELSGRSISLQRESEIRESLHSAESSPIGRAQASWRGRS